MPVDLSFHVQLRGVHIHSVDLASCFLLLLFELNSFKRWARCSYMQTVDVEEWLPLDHGIICSCKFEPDMPCKKMQSFLGATCNLFGGQLASAQTPRSRRNLEGQQSELLDFVGSILLCLCPSAWEPSCCAY